MKEPENAEFEIIVRGGKEYKVSYATKEQIEQIETSILDKCKPYLGKLKDLNDEEFLEFLNDKAMSWDVERGLIPSQIPHRIYRHTAEFKAFEDSLWDEINLRLDKTGEEFFKIEKTK